MFEVSVNNTATFRDTLEMGHTTWVLLLNLNILMFIAGFTGNVVVLIGSVKFSAIKMDHCSRLFVENIALADCLIMLVKVLPRILVIAFNGWHLGKAVCFASFAIKITLFIAESLVTTGMACYRLHVLRTIVNVVKVRYMQVFIGTTWIFAITYISILIGSDIVGYYNPYLIGCGGVMRRAAWMHFQHTAGIILSVVPICLILATNIWILFIAGNYTRKRTGRGGPKRSAVTMVACICWGFLLSWTPYLAIWVCGLCNIAVPPICITIAEHAITINAVINPVIYTTTNNTFRVFLLGLVKDGVLCTPRGAKKSNSVIIRDGSFNTSQRKRLRSRVLSGGSGHGGSMNSCRIKMLERTKLSESRRNCFSPEDTRSFLKIPSNENSIMLLSTTESGSRDTLKSRDNDNKSRDDENQEGGMMENGKV